MLARSLTRARHKNAGRPPEKSAEGFKQWVRGRPCYLADRGSCAGAPTRKPVEFDHVDGYAAGKGMGTKSADRCGYPLCPKHHDEQHRGIKTFEAKYGLTGASVAAQYWAAWPGRIAWEKSREC